MTTTFEPNGQPGEASLVAQQQETTNQSWMAKAQDMRLNKQREEANALTLEKEKANQPIEQAKRAADLLTFHASATNSETAQRLRMRAASESPTVVDEYLKILSPESNSVEGSYANEGLNEDGSTNYEKQYKALASLQSKYGYMGLVPEHKPIIDAINTSMKNAYDMTVKHNVALLALEKTKQNLQGRLDQISLQGINSINTATQTGVNQAGVQTIRNQGTANVATIGANSRSAVQESKNLSAIQREQMKNFSIAADNSERMAEKETDPDKASALISRANNFRAKSDAIVNSITDVKASAKGMDINVPSMGTKSGASLPVIKTPEEAAALPPGTLFEGPDGVIYRTKSSEPTQ